MGGGILIFSIGLFLKLQKYTYICKLNDAFLKFGNNICVAENIIKIQKLIQCQN